MHISSKKGSHSLKIRTEGKLNPSSIDIPVGRVPVSTCGRRDMPFCVPLVSDVHVTPQALTPLNAIPVIYFDLGGPGDSQKCITCPEKVEVNTRPEIESNLQHRAAPEVDAEAIS